MRRLKDLEAPASPIEADAVGLLRSATGYEPPPGQKQMVRARLLAQRVIVHRGVRFRPSVAAAIVLFGAVASAAAGRDWIARTVESLAQPGVGPRPAGVPALRNPARRAGAKIATAEKNEIVIAELTGATEVATTQPVPERTATAERGMMARRRAPGGIGHMGGRRAALAKAGPGRSTLTGPNITGAARTEIALAPEIGTPTSAPPAGDGPERTRRSDDSGLVFDAMHALRQQRAPVHAMKLLDEYSLRHPGGPLAEETLALSIEAAAMHGDLRAMDLINQYLSRYPTGHFRAAVELARAHLLP